MPFSNICLQVHENSDQTFIVKFDRATIHKQSKIFNPADREANTFEAAINAASMKLCMQDGSLLPNRQLLLKKARDVVDREGYAYKKGKSRSVLLNPEEGSRKKRSYVSSEIRARS